MRNRSEKTALPASAWGRVSYRKGLLLGLVACVMFAFSYLLVPMYDVLCYQFGVNGKVPESSLSVSSPSSILGATASDRRVTVQFLTANYARMPWAFSALSAQVSVHPDQVTTQYFTVENTTDRPMKAAAVNSVAPAGAAKHIKFTHNFARRVIALQPHEKKQLPVSLYIDGQLPPSVHVVTIFYTLFDQGAPTHG